MGKNDYKHTVSGLCKFINKNEAYKKMDPPPKCAGEGQYHHWEEDPLTITGCTPAVVEELPHIKF